MWRCAFILAHRHLILILNLSRAASRHTSVCESSSGDSSRGAVEFWLCARLPLPPAVQKLQMGCRSPNFDSKDENPVAILKTPEVEIMIAENLMTVRELRGGRE